MSFFNTPAQARFFSMFVHGLLLFSLFLAFPSFSQNIEIDRNKRINISKAVSSPVIDGILDDDTWTMISPVEDFHQYEPFDHIMPSQKTLMYITFDENYFYVAAELLDSEPDQIRARSLIKNASLQYDDSFTIYLDPFNNRRSGYYFQVNPNGATVDAVFSDYRQLNRNWEGIWEARATINDRGWVAEMAIPLDTINFNPNISDWGFSAERTVARNLEQIAWSSFNGNINLTTLGSISGLYGLEQGLGLDITPSFVSLRNKNFAEKESSSSNTEPSLDITYNFSPSLKGALTFNTDFASTESDTQRVNLTRFSLFYPEKRDFFLQDTDIFSFADRNSAFGNGRNGIPFYSRRVGLSKEGAPLDLDMGAKISGRIGRWNVGMLNVQQEDINGVDENLLVARVSANVLEQSSVGFITTRGDPNSNLDNSLVGLDFNYVNSRILDGSTLTGGLWAQQSDTEGVDDKQGAFGVRGAVIRREGFRGGVNFTQFQENYNPALGFANRKGVNYLRSVIAYRKFLPNHSWLTSWNSQLQFAAHEKISGRAENSLFFLSPIQIVTRSGVEMDLQVKQERVVLEENFNIYKDTNILTGDYTWNTISLEIEGAEERDFAPAIEVETGDFYDGKRSEYSLGLNMRPSDNLYLNLSYKYNDIALPMGDFSTKEVSLRINYAFNVRWSWRNLIQYDNESNSAGINSRLQWTPRSGRDLYVVLNHGFKTLDRFDNLGSDQSQFAIKYTQTFRL
ncbi:MAG: hypothetical protein CBC38_07425 [Gammaproteobacteria bacterium TMED78]|nr:MAG: hypothetical protein CBC38_07425 [Gammaproteobacteria bacterium TMED78]|tara:strand:+ start:131 stop:2344 length:2214 start_codon:yes stop_codon:yes gene_type:complete